MSPFQKKRNEQKSAFLQQQNDKWNAPLADCKISASLDQNIATVKKLFCDVDMARFKTVGGNTPEEGRFFLVFIDGMVHSEIINNNILKPLMLHSKAGHMNMEDLLSQVVQISETKTVETFKEAVESVTYGDTLLFAEGSVKAAILNTKQFTLRSISEPDNEKVLSGPREGFTESLTQNFSQIQRRLRTNELKSKKITLGTRTQTCIFVCYVESIADKKVLKEVFRRLQTIEIDGILDSNYITELIRDHRFSPFRTTGYTERPDVAVAKLLEGRIAILVDGSPMVLTVPYLFIENFQSNEDYYFNFYYASSSRILRMLAFLLTVTVPGLYIATVAFHQEMLPLPLMIRIAMERQNVPLPAALEALIMLLVFDILRETGIRMPSNIGQALSIVGALVIGQAAVEATLVAAPMIIVVAATGITSLLVPRLNAPILLWRLALLFGAATFGFFGLSIALSVLVISINNLTSFGKEQISLRGYFQFQQNKDTFIRAPWWTMRTRPSSLSGNVVRQKEGETDG